MSLMRSTSSGHTSTHTVHPLSAMHLASSTTTGTVVLVVARGMVILLFALGFSALDADALFVVKVLLVLGDRNHVRLHCTLLACHARHLVLHRSVWQNQFSLFFSG